MITIALPMSVLIVGIALALVGLRGRRIDDHPLCRRCGFDLTGKPVSSTRCPECGAELERQRAVVVGHRQRQKWPLRGGVALAAMAAVALGILSWARLNHVNWLHYAPTSYLIRRAGLTDAGKRSPALVELIDRYKTGHLQVSALDQAADAGLAYQGDLSKPWDPLWGILLERARTNGQLSDPRWTRYAAQAAVGVYRALTLRMRVRRGDLLPFSIAVQYGRVAPNSTLYVNLHDVRLCWNDGQRSDPLVLFPKRVCDPYETSIGSSWPAKSLPSKLPAGEQSVYLTGVMWVGAPHGYDDVTPTAVVPLDLPGTTTAVSENEPSVVLVPDPLKQDAIYRSIRFRPPVDRGGGNFGTAMIDVNGNPVALSFAIFLRTVDGVEHPAGKVAMAANLSHHSVGLGAWPTSMIGQPVDVILRSDPSAAVDTVDVTRAWAGTLIFKNVR